MPLHTFFLILSLLVFFVALATGVYMRRSKFFGYEGIARDVERLARLLGAEIFRDGSDLVVRGNYAKLPVLVRFSLATDSSGLSINMQAPANFQMTVIPTASSRREEGTRVRTEDGLFDFKFVTTSPQPALARMFVASAGALRSIKKLCWSSSTSLHVDSGKLELLERPFDVAHVFDYIQNHLSTMQNLAESLRAMPGADVIQIQPFRKPGTRFLKPAVALGLSIALLEASRLSGAGMAHSSALAAEPAVQAGVLPSDAARILYLQGWRLAQESDFDSDAMAWLRMQGATPSGTVQGNFSGKDINRDAAYILVDDQGIMRVVLISEGRLVYDQRYRKILGAARVPASNLSTVPWREPLPGKPDGDGLLILTKSDTPGSSVIFAVKDGSLILGLPTDYLKVVL